MNQYGGEGPVNFEEDVVSLSPPVRASLRSLLRDLNWSAKPEMDRGESNRQNEGKDEDKKQTSMENLEKAFEMFWSISQASPKWNSEKPPYRKFGNVACTFFTLGIISQALAGLPLDVPPDRVVDIVFQEIFSGCNTFLLELCRVSEHTGIRENMDWGDPTNLRNWHLSFDDVQKGRNNRTADRYKNQVFLRETYKAVWLAEVKHVGWVKTWAGYAEQLQKILFDWPDFFRDLKIDDGMIGILGGTGEALALTWKNSQITLWDSHTRRVEDDKPWALTIRTKSWVDSLTFLGTKILVYGTNTGQILKWEFWLFSGIDLEPQNKGRLWGRLHGKGIQRSTPPKMVMGKNVETQEEEGRTQKCIDDKAEVEEVEERREPTIRLLDEEVVGAKYLGAAKEISLDPPHKIQITVDGKLRLNASRGSRNKIEGEGTTLNSGMIVSASASWEDASGRVCYLLPETLNHKKGWIYSCSHTDATKQLCIDLSEKVSKENDEQPKNKKQQCKEPAWQVDLLGKGMGDLRRCG